jgi:hypothetical protein
MTSQAMILWKALSFWGRFEITYYMHESVKLCAKVSCVITRLPVLYDHYAYGYQPSSGTLLQICTKLTNLNIPSNEIYEFRDITDQGVKPKWYYRYIYCLFYNSLPEQTQTTFYVSAIKM